MRFFNHRVHQRRHSERRSFDNEYSCGEVYYRHRHGGTGAGYGGRGEGKRRFFERGEFKFALLELLVPEPRHGYQLIKAMEEKTGGLYSPSAGSVYPNLQLLEDMKLIGCNETDGKKLYHITDEGLIYLREREREDNDRPENRRRHHGWNGHGKYGGHGKHRKHDLRDFMKEWSDVIYLMANAAGAAQENPSSKQAVRFQELMTKFQDSLKEVLASVPDSSMNEAVKPPSDLDSKGS